MPESIQCQQHRTNYNRLCHIKTEAQIFHFDKIVITKPLIVKMTTQRRKFHQNDSILVSLSYGSFGQFPFRDHWPEHCFYEIKPIDQISSSLVSEISQTAKPSDRYQLHMDPTLSRRLILNTVDWKMFWKKWWVWIVSKETHCNNCIFWLRNI